MKLPEFSEVSEWNMAGLINILRFKIFSFITQAEINMNLRDIYLGVQMLYDNSAYQFPPNIAQSFEKELFEINKVISGISQTDTEYAEANRSQAFHMLRKLKNRITRQMFVLGMMIPRTPTKDFDALLGGIEPSEYEGNMEAKT